MKKIYKLLIAANLVVIILLFSALSVMADWQPVNGVSGNTVKCITRTGTGDIFAGTFDGGVFSSGDNGKTWKARNNGITIYPILSITSIGTKLYAGSSGSGLFKSDDYGVTWVAVNNGLTNNSILSLYAVSETEVYAGTEGSGIFKTIDGGANWIPINTGLSNLYIRSIVKKGSDFFVGTGNGIYRSSDSGENWWLRGLSGNQVNALFVDGANLFAGTATNGIYWSSTSGASWVQKYCCGYDVRSFSSDGTAVYSATYGSGIVRTSDNGTTWNPVNNGINNLYVEALYGYTSTGGNHYVIAGSHGGGIFITSDLGANWSCKKIGLTSYDIRALASVSTGYPNLLAGAYSGRTFLTADNGNCWTQVKDGNTSVRTISTVVTGASTSNTYAGTYGGGVFKSTDDGINWLSLNGSGSTGLGNLFVMCSGINIADGYLYVGTVGGGVYKTFGTSPPTWIQAGLTGKDVRSITFNGTDIYAGTSGNGVYKSTNGGTSWTQINTGLTNLTVYAMATLGADIYAGTYGGGIFKLAGGTGSWTQVNTGLTNLQVWSFVVNAGVLYAGTEGGGIFMSNNAGVNWYLVNAGIPSVQIFSLCVQGTNFFAGTGNGVYSRPITELGVPCPVAAGVISGASNVCALDPTWILVPYSVGAIGNATGYQWEYSTTGGIYDIPTSVPNLLLPINNTILSGSLKVRGVSTCTGDWSPDFPITVSSSIPFTPGWTYVTPNVCQGSNGIAYSVSPIPNATGYIWILPSGAYIASGANTNAITVNFSNTAVSGPISVYATNACGSTITPLNTYVTVANVLGSGSIDGNQYICSNILLAAIYTATIPGAMDYVWTVPSWATILSGQHTDHIQVSFLPNSASGNISVHGSNGVCQGNEIYYPVYVGTVVPGPAGPITGPATVCQGQTGVVYSVATIPNATLYHWVLPPGASIVSSGYNFQTITVNFSNTFAGGGLSVCGSTGCDGLQSTLMINRNLLPDTPGTITGPITVTQGQTGVNYWVSPVANATAYHWTVPNGATIMSGANTNSILVNFSNWAVTDTLRVYCSNDCGNGQTTKEKITVNPVMHFQFVGGDASDWVWTIYFQGATLVGADLQPGDEIAVFDGDIMVGAYQLTEVLTPAGSVHNFISAYRTLANGAPGYTPGNPYTYRYWDASAGIEIGNVTVTKIDAGAGTNTWMGDVFPPDDLRFSVHTLSAAAVTPPVPLETITFNLPATPPQFISSYVIPPDPDMLVVLSGMLNGNLNKVKNTAGASVRKIGANWVNGIGSWVNTEGYIFYMNGPANFSITGNAINDQTLIHFATSGIKIIGYIKDHDVNAKDVFESYFNAGQIDIVKNSNGNILRKIGGTWVNNIGNLNVGQGYMINVVTPTPPALFVPFDFQYPAGKKATTSIKSATAQHFVVEGGDASEPVYTVYISGATINGYNLQQGDEIGVYDGENLVGSLALTQTPNGDNQFENAIPVFSAIVDGDGYTANHPLNFKIWKASDNTEYADVPFNLSNPGGEALMTGLYPEEDGVYSVASLKMTSAGLSNDQLITNTVAIYPNPFSNTIHIEYYLNETANVNISVYNSVGQEIATLMNRQQAAGKQNLQFDGSKLQQGIYNLKIMVSNGNNKFSEIRKIVLMK